MTAAVVVRENSNLQCHAAYIDSKKELIKRMFCKGSSDEEFELFTHACKHTGLDPVMKQIYAVKRWSNADKREVMSIQTSIDGFRLIAERTGNYSPGKEPTYVYDSNGKVISATSYVKKRTSDGTWHDVAASAYYDEYVQRNKEGKPMQFWERMPHVMLSKCAESLALRKAFPAELSGIYTQEEMSQANSSVTAEEQTLTESQVGKLSSLMDQILDTEYFVKLQEFLKVETLWDIKPRDYERTVRSLENKIKIQKEAENEQSTVA